MEVLKFDISTDQKIINTLLLNASFIDNLGLMHGKMGISILFYHLARKYNNKIYEEYAGELIDEIYEEITTSTPTNFENGLAGIGWGIEYLVQNGFLEAETDEVLQEFDNRLFKELIYNTPSEIGISKGLLGIGYYYLNRIEKKDVTGNENIAQLTNKQTIIYLIDEIERRTENVSSLIKEPGLTTENESKDSIQSNNIDNKEDSLNLKHTPLFSLTWSYSSLVWFLAEVLEKKIMNFKVEKIIYQLTEPLSNQANLPKLQLNRLMLLTALLKLKKVLYNDVDKIPNLENIINTILQVDISQIYDELPKNDMSLQSGISGVISLFGKLQWFNGSNFLKEETDYCQSILFQSLENNTEDLNISYNKDDNDFGVLTGVSGPILISTLYH